MTYHDDRYNRLEGLVDSTSVKLRAIVPSTSGDNDDYTSGDLYAVVPSTSVNYTSGHSTMTVVLWCIIWFALGTVLGAFLLLWYLSYLRVPVL